MNSQRALTLFALLCSPPLLAADPLVAFEQEKYKGRVGETVEVLIVVKAFDRLDAGGVDLKYDPSALRVTNVAIDTRVWRFANRSGDVDNEQGLIRNIGFSDFQGVPGPEAVIGSVTFTALRPGASTVALSSVQLNPFAANGAQVPVTYGQSTVLLSGSSGRK